jgi:single-stranded DNA-binding protein
VATNHCFKDREGSPVHVIGRLRIQKYTGADGVERQAGEIVASKVESF